jgi:hypothetical protein
VPPDIVTWAEPWLTEILAPMLLAAMPVGVMMPLAAVKVCIPSERKSMDDAALAVEAGTLVGGITPLSPIMI